MANTTSKKLRPEPTGYVSDADFGRRLSVFNSILGAVGNGGYSRSGRSASAFSARARGGHVTIGGSHRSSFQGDGRGGAGDALALARGLGLLGGDGGADGAGSGDKWWMPRDTWMKPEVGKDGKPTGRMTARPYSGTDFGDENNIYGSGRFGGGVLNPQLKAQMISDRLAGLDPGSSTYGRAKAAAEAEVRGIWNAGVQSWLNYSRGQRELMYRERMDARAKTRKEQALQSAGKPVATEATMQQPAPTATQPTATQPTATQPTATQPTSGKNTADTDWAVDKELSTAATRVMSRTKNGKKEYKADPTAAEENSRLGAVALDGSGFETSGVGIGRGRVLFSGSSERYVEAKRDADESKEALDAYRGVPEYERSEQDVKDLKDAEQEAAGYKVIADVRRDDVALDASRINRRLSKWH